MSITLPPLPPTYENHAGVWVNVDDIRARDLAVAKRVLEAAIARVKSRFDYEAAAMAHHAGTWYAASKYHADRVRATSQMLDILSDLEVPHE